MATRNQNLHSVLGRLCYGVTDISTGTFPYDGTELGLVSKLHLFPPVGVYHLQAEEDGATIRTVYNGGDAVVAVQLMNWHTDPLTVLFPGISVGADSGTVVTFPSKVGQQVSTISNLYFEAKDPEHVSWFMPVAAPAMEEQAKLWFSGYRVLGFPALFRSQADANGRALVMGLKADLTAL